MAFRPDTKYYIGSKEYDTIYEAFDPTPNLNNGEYFTGTAFKECYIKRGSDSYVAWNYNSSFNQYAVAFNDEFIDVSVGSTEKADISYKGRDNNSKLIVT